VDLKEIEQKSLINHKAAEIKVDDNLISSIPENKKLETKKE